MRTLPADPLIQESTNPAVLLLARLDGKSVAAAWRFKPNPSAQEFLRRHDWFKVMRNAVDGFEGCDRKPGEHTVTIDCLNDSHWNAFKKHVIGSNPAIKPVFDQIAEIDRALWMSHGTLFFKRDFRIESGNDRNLVDGLHRDNRSDRYGTILTGITTEGIADGQPFSFANNHLFWSGSKSRGLLHRRRMNGLPRLSYFTYPSFLPRL